MAFVISLASVLLAHDVYAAAIVIGTPPNGLKAKSLPGNPINGTGNPAGNAVTGGVFFQANNIGNFVQIDSLWIMATTPTLTWTKSAQSGTNVYTAKGTYRYTAQLLSFPPVNTFNLCTIP